MQVLSGIAAITLCLVLLALGCAALALLYRRRGEQRDVQFESDAEAWDPLLLAYLFDDVSPESVVGALDDRERLRFLAHLLTYSRRLAGDDRAKIQRLARPLLGLVRDRLTRRSAAVRARAVQTLGELGWPDYADEVVNALDDPSPLVALIAMQILCRPEGSPHIPDVLGRLDRFTSWTPRFLGATLASAGQDACAALRWALADPGTDPQVKIAVAEALRLLNDFHAADVALSVLESDHDRDVLAAVLRLIGTVGRSEHGPTVAAMTTSEDFVVRVAAADGLAGIGGPQELERLRTMVFEDPSPWVALRAARSLGQAGWNAALRALADSSHDRASVGAQVLAEGAGR